MNTIGLPAESDWRSEPWGIDSKDAYDHFNGKDISKAVRLFSLNFMYYSEDLLYMPKKCFQYYLYSLILFLRSDSSVEEIISPHFLFSVIECRYRDIIENANLVESLLDVLSFLKSEKERFGEYIDLKNDYDSKLKHCVDILTQGGLPGTD